MFWTSAAPDVGPGDYWRSLQIKLRRLNDAHNVGATPADPAVAALIESFTPGSSTDIANLHEAEQRLFQLVPDPIVTAEFTGRIIEADTYQISGAATLKSEFSAATDPTLRRALLLRLIEELQRDHRQFRKDQGARESASERLSTAGRWIVLPTLALLVVLFAGSSLMSLAQGAFADGATAAQPNHGRILRLFAEYHLLAVCWFGVIGAYFSRLISFQQKSGEMGYRAIQAEFSAASIRLRLFVGVIGALIMYLIMKADMIGGLLFPNFEKFTFLDETSLGALDQVAGGGDKPVDPTPATEAGPVPAATECGLVPAATECGPVPAATECGQVPAATECGEVPAATECGPVPAATDPPTGIPAPPQTGQPLTARAPEPAPRLPLISSDFARLLVWSLLAGFSERLIPDRFAALEAASKEAEPRKT
jgi:hypothetical protein